MSFNPLLIGGAAPPMRSTTIRPRALGSTRFNPLLIGGAAPPGRTPVWFGQDGDVSIPFSSGGRRRHDIRAWRDVGILRFQSPSHRGGGAAQPIYELAEGYW